ncbi:MAG: HEAT repeat domain-containing protein, partial [Planctomycetes bacterium]|nr:HEAT repeat domain-containing protein [Planctomycetota bacterium]
MKGVANQILKATPFCDDSHLRLAARLALVATSRGEDAPLLRRALKHEDPYIRRAAVSALAAALGQRRVDDMLPLLDHADGWMRFESARALANIGDRRSLTALGQLLQSDDLKLRVQSAGLLRALTKQFIVFTAYDKPEVRRRQAEKWQTWIDSEGRTAKLHFPVNSFVANEIGHTLVSLYKLHKVIELDAEGKEIRTITGGKGPWGAVPLPNGNVLVNWFGSHSVVEYDRQGKEVWKWSRAGVEYVWSAQRLDNGNTLIACRNVVLEVDPAGKTIWETTLGTHHSHALRLENGNTLVSIQHTNGKVVELDREGKVVWQIVGLRNPYRLQRLANGNTLITEKGRNRVVEFDASGKKEVWSKDGFLSPDSAQRLLNGNTLVSDQRAIYEVDPAGKII